MTTTTTTTATAERARDEHIHLSLGTFALAGAASLGAGAIHAAAVGAHSEHRQAVVVFVAVAVFQLAWGAWALVDTNPLIAAVGMVGNLGLVAGWAGAKTSGISFIDGLEATERVQFADAAAAALAAVAAFAVLARVLDSRPDHHGHGPSRPLAWVTSLAVLGLSVPAMVASGGHAHGDSHDPVTVATADGGSTTGTAAAADGHTHPSDETAATVADAVNDDIDAELTAQVAGATHDHATTVVAKPYDPTLPIDLSGTPGVTPQQQAAAENLIAVTLARLPQFADPAAAEAFGWHSIGDGLTGFEHLINWQLINDDKTLDPDYPEALVYAVDRAKGTRTLVSAMFMLSKGSRLDSVPEIGGALMQWHIHDNLCLSGDPEQGVEAPKVVGITDGSGNCRFGVKLIAVPMIHVWITAHRCGPFAALEGVGAGQIKPGEERLCDRAHGAGF